MNEKKWTPGEWVWAENRLNSSYGLVLDWDRHEGMWFARMSDDENEANKQVMAAAPLLYENLQGCMEALASHAPDCLEVELARRALAKARGEL